MWVTLEIPRPEDDRRPHHVRGRVRWVQRPLGVRDMFQIGLELEIPGNFWGIAMSPPDWIPFPDTNAQEIALAPVERAESAAHEDIGEHRKAEAALLGHLRMVSSNGDSELLRPRAQHMEVVESEGRHELHETIGERAAGTRSAEAQPLIAALYAHFHEAERRGTPGGDGVSDTPGSRTMSAAEAAGSDPLKMRDESREELESTLQTVREQWNREITESTRHASERVAAELSQLEQERWGEFEQRVEAKLRQAIDNLEWAAGEARSKVAHAQESLAELREHAEEAAVPLRAVEESLRAQAEICHGQLDALESAAQQVQERIASSVDKAQADWQSRLEASMGGRRRPIHRTRARKP